MEQRRKRGFTLAEVLLVVAILSILLAIAAPNIIEYRLRLKLTELDDSARSIFVAAQNRLTGLHGAGADFSGLEGNKVNLRLPAGTGAPELLYAVSDDGETDELIPAGSIESELQQNHYVVEFDPDSGAVYAVWYWEKGSFTYETDAYSRAKADRESRLKAGVEVGYYGGTGVDRVKIGQMPFPEVTLVNAEELVLTITVPTADPKISDENILVTVSVNDEELPLEGNARHLSQGKTGTVVLDTLKPEAYRAMTAPADDNWKVGNSFRGWDIPGVDPGEELKIRVTLSYDGGDFTPQSFYVDGNSLFASREGETAYIAYGRHLQNLDPDVSGVTYDITRAVQTADIDFDTTAGESVYSWRDTYAGMAFKPVSNDALLSYDGGWHTVKGLTTKEAENAGVFAETVTGFKAADLTLIDARVTGTDAAGALVGRAKGTLTVENCGAYIRPEGVKPAVSAPSGTAGGLVGVTDGALKVDNSFASVPVNGGTVGGLVGNVHGAEIIESYAAGDLTGVTVGGLVGGADGQIVLKNSYAAGVIESGSTVGGITPASDISLEDDPAGIATYAAAVYGDSFEGTAATATVYGAYPGGASVKYVHQGGVKFASSSGDGTLKATGTELGTAWPYHLTDKTKGLTTAYPYARTARGKDGELLPHYGDWLELLVQSTELAYVEWYGDGGIDGVGLYSARVDVDGAKAVRNSLEGDGAVVTRDGYRVISTLAPTTIGGAAPVEDAALTALLPDGFMAYKIDNTTSVPGALYKALTVADSEGVKEFIYNPDFACEAFEVTGGTVMPPAELLDKPDAEYEGSVTPGAVVRTARHLANVSEYTQAVPEAAGWSFTQLHNVDYRTYEKTCDGSAFETGKDDAHRQTPAKLGTGGKYDGRGHTVSNIWLGMDTEGRSGLFGSVSGGAVAQDLTLVNVNAEGTGDTGALAGYFGNGTIDGCGVYCEKNPTTDYTTHIP